MLKLFVSFVIVAFGQPAFSPILGVFASLFGYALFWSVLIQVQTAKRRFWSATLWFGAVQAVQLSWLLSHPYSYIFGLYFFLCFLIGLQFGVLGIFINQDRIHKWPNLLAIAGLYTLLEWSRLFYFSGFSLNPIGLAMTGTLFGLQGASLFGVYGLTFFVLVVNLMCLRLFLYTRTILSVGIWAFMCILPYLFGYLHVTLHQKQIAEKELNALLVQTAFPIEESLVFSSFSESVKYVLHEWEEIIGVLKPFLDRDVDLIVLPEYVVPYGTYMAIFPYEDIKNLFGSEHQNKLPPLKEPLALKLDNGWQVTNAYICQAIADLFQSDVVVGLQDDQWVSLHEKESYSSAFYFWPGGDVGFRYEKRVLLPMGEYIPFEFCKKIAADYGITGSFIPGTEAKVFPGCKVPFGPSICYEETFGSLMRESRLNGSKLLVNATSDIWYPNSKLPKQHFDHARLRTVESGIPLVRACNTGITGAFNSLGEILAETKAEDEWVRQGLFVKVPIYNYSTLYLLLGDTFIVALSALFSLLLLKKSS